MDGTYYPALTSPTDILASARPVPPLTPANKKAAEEFEAVYLAQMLKPMFDSVEIDPTFGGGAAEETWRSIQVDEMAKQIARNGGIGLADVVAKEMLRLQEVADGHR